MYSDHILIDWDVAAKLDHVLILGIYILIASSGKPEIIHASTSVTLHIFLAT